MLIVKIIFLRESSSIILIIIASLLHIFSVATAAVISQKQLVWRILSANHYNILTTCQTAVTMIMPQKQHCIGISTLRKAFQELATRQAHLPAEKASESQKRKREKWKRATFFGIQVQGNGIVYISTTWISCLLPLFNNNNQCDNTNLSGCFWQVF